MATTTRRRSWRIKDRRQGYLFVAPQALGTAIFVLAPFVTGILLSFSKWDGLSAPEWVGLANFATVFTDIQFLKSIVNTALLGLITIPVGLGLALLVAVGMDQIRGRTFYLICFFAPVLTSSVAVSLVWQQILRADGILSVRLGQVFGITAPDWLNNPRLVLIAVCLVTIWSSLGINIVIYLAGLQSIPPNLIEAARIDGAGPWSQLVRIKVPMLSPVIFFTVVISVIGSLQTFDTVYILTGGTGPEDSSRMIVYHIFELGFRRFELGVASAASTVLLVLTLGVTAIQLLLQRHVVHYES